jgi:hypothetical protein
LARFVILSRSSLRGCGWRFRLSGIDRRYLAERGDDELSPYHEGRVLDAERVRYLPAFVCKTTPFAEARSAVRQAFAEARLMSA